MKILTPFNDIKYLEPLLDAGADEFYIGFFSDEWKQRFGRYSDINRLTLFKETANRYTLADMAEITRQVHAAGKPLYITLNAPGYHREELELLAEYIRTLGSFGVDGIITGIPEMTDLIHRNGMKAIASTMCGIQNADLAGWYRDMGIDRIIFPRELATHEMYSIIQAVPEPEYEAFLMRNGCRYQDVNCLGLHGGKHGALCYSLRFGDTVCYGRPGSGDFAAWLEQAHDTFCHAFHEFTCGQCAIYRLNRIGVGTFKIVGRLDDPDEILQDVALTKKNIEIAAQCDSEEAYLSAMTLPGDFEQYCRHGLSCYYPEVRWR